MGADLEPLIEALESDLAKAQPVRNLLELKPGLTVEEAYRIQLALMDRAAAAGDTIVGYKAALTSQAMQTQLGVAEPLLGTLIASRHFGEEGPIALGGFIHATLEPEIAVLLKADLPGPGVTALQALSAVEAYLPAVELGDYRTPESARSPAQLVACNTLNGGWIVGGPPVSPLGLDLRLEGMVLRANGRVRGSATAVEVLGDPIHSVVFMANKLAELGLSLKAGMVLLTGSIVASIPVNPGDEVRVSFTHLGELALSFVE